ncbi:hypothetical protein [Arthrobacter sp. UYCo732]|uniref:hypothetical protein n=1 Tax=Arthrobacter sp. UYCo732 TaxID=3156336 RepID=UPI003396AED6
MSRASNSKIRESHEQDRWRPDFKVVGVMVAGFFGLVSLLVLASWGSNAFGLLAIIIDNDEHG